MLIEIKKFIEKTKPDGLVTRLKSNQLYWAEIEQYSQNIKTTNHSEKIYLYINQTTQPKCQCGNDVKFVSIVKGYNTFCKSNCQYAKLSQVAARKLAMPNGVGLADPKTKEKAMNTLMLKHGVINPSQIEENRINLSENNGMKRPEVVEQLRKSAMEYGVDWHSKRQDVRDKMKSTTMEIYGVENIAQKNISKETLKILNDKPKMEELFNNKSIAEISTELQVCDTTILKYLRINGIREKFQNTPEKQLIEILSSFGFNPISRSRKIIPPFEIDIFIPEKNLAIEFCGLYWHGEKGINGYDKSYHLNKMTLCNEKNIRLITIFEDEWLNNREICISRLKHILGIATKGVGARKLKITKITIEQSKPFIISNHIQGYANATINYGAFLGEEMVAVMTFNKQRKSLGYKGENFEMIRFCTLGNFPGVGGKMFKTFLKDQSPLEVISFCDLRWGTGNLYRQLGFVFEKNTKPGYWYFGGKDKYRRVHRWMFRKSEIVSKYNGDPEKSEWENMQTMGYDRIWDCGHGKWVYRNDNL